MNKGKVLIAAGAILLLAGCAPSPGGSITLATVQQDAPMFLGILNAQLTVVKDIPGAGSSTIAAVQGYVADAQQAVTNINNATSLTATTPMLQQIAADVAAASQTFANDPAVPQTARDALEALSVTISGVLFLI